MQNIVYFDHRGNVTCTLHMTQALEDKVSGDRKLVLIYHDDCDIERVYKCKEQYFCHLHQHSVTIMCLEAVPSNSIYCKNANLGPVVKSVLKRHVQYVRSVSLLH